MKTKVAILAGVAAVLSMLMPVSVDVSAAALEDPKDPKLKRTAMRPDPPCFDNLSRYADCGNGTVTDVVTGLIWLQQPNCLLPAFWAQANQAAAELQHGDCDLSDNSRPGDWRLPTAAEWNATFFTGLQRGCTSPALTNVEGSACLSIGPTPFIGLPAGLFWTSSVSLIQPWNFSNVADVDAGFVGSTMKFELWNVWPVRRGAQQ